MLERQAHFLGFGVELHDFDLHHVTDLDDLGRMLDARVRELAVVNETIHAAEVDECAELSQSDDHAFANLSDFERSEQLLFLRVELFFENQPLRKHDAMTLVIEIDHFRAQALSDQLVEIADGLPANLRCGNESAHAKIDENAAFYDLRDRCFDYLVLLVRFNDFLPRLQRACAPFGEIAARHHHRCDESSLRACRRP